MAKEDTSHIRTWILLQEQGDLRRRHFPAWRTNLEAVDFAEPISNHRRKTWKESTAYLG